MAIHSRLVKIILLIPLCFAVKVLMTQSLCDDHIAVFLSSLLPTERGLVIEILCYLYTFFILTQELNPTARLLMDRDLDLSCLFTLVVMEMKNQSLTAHLTRILVHVPMMMLLVLYVLKVSCMHVT